MTESNPTATTTPTAEQQLDYKLGLSFLLTQLKEGALDPKKTAQVFAVLDRYASSSGSKINPKELMQLKCELLAVPTFQVDMQEKYLERLKFVYCCTEWERGSLKPIFQEPQPCVIL